MNTTATNDVIAKEGVAPKKKKSIADKVNQVNQGWDILGELGDNKFQIPTRKKQVNVESVENNIVAIAKADSEVIKNYEEQSKGSLATAQKEIQAIKAQSQVEVDDLMIAKESIIVQPVIVEQPAVQPVAIHVPIQNTPVVQSQAKAEPLQTVQAFSAKKAAIENNDLTQEQLMANKNVFFKMVMRGLAQLYVDKTTSLFNPVVFIAKNYKFLLHTTVLLGLPAIITWYLFTHITSLNNAVTSVSTPMYVFYSLMFYTAALFLCLTLQVVVIGFWTMIKKSMSEVAMQANKEANIKK